MENSKELKPCPFCGGEAERVDIDSTDEMEPMDQFIVAVVCAVWAVVRSKG